MQTFLVGILSLVRVVSRPCPSVRSSAALGIVLLCGAASTYGQNLVIDVYGAQRTQGYGVRAPLVQAADGNFYATAFNAGANGEGNIIQLTPEGVATMVYSFPALAANGTNLVGASPEGGLLVGHDGNLYGSTTAGGAFGFGTLFEFMTNGTVTPVASFPTPADAFGPPVEDSGGDFYYFGTPTDPSQGTITIFKVTPAGTVLTYHVFSPLNADGTNFEGANPTTGLVIDGTGTLSGFARSGGANGLGTFYQVGPGGQIVAVRHNYGVSDTVPYPSDNSSTIVATSAGTIYGVAEGGDNGSGLIFKADSGPPTILYSFDAATNNGNGLYINTNGAGPVSLTLGSDGNLYGVTSGGGANGTGTVFESDPYGNHTTLYTFTPDAYASVPPILSTNGDLYGTSFGGTGPYYRLGATLLPAFNSASLSATATVDVPFSYQLVVTNDPTSYTSSVLSDGLILDPTTGLITGSPTTLGTTAVTLTATNPDGTSTATLTITVIANAANVPVITVPSTPLTATVGQPFNYQINASHSPSSYSGLDLPGNLTVDPITGQVRGYFSNPGKFLLEFKAYNLSGTATATLEVDVTAVATVPTATVTEAAEANAATGQKGLFLVTLSAASGVELAISYKVKGDAEAGVDYKALTGVVTIPAGATSAKIKVKPKHNPDANGTKVVKIVLEAGTGYTVGPTPSARVKIQ